MAHPITEVMHLTPQELAKRCRSSENTLAGWRVKGQGPRWIKFGRKVLYPICEVEAWEMEHIRGNLTID